MSTINSMKYDVSAYSAIKINLEKRLTVERALAQFQHLLEFYARVDKLPFVIDSFGEFIQHMENHLPDIVCDDEEEALPFDD